MPGVDDPRAEAAGARDGPAAAEHPPPEREPGRVGVLTRPERVAQAAAYRLTVEAVYGTVPGRYPAEYAPASHEPPRVDRPHEPPGRWLREINDDWRLPGRRNNCGECARAVHSTWHGEATAAAALSDPRSDGEPTRRMAEWADRRPVPATMTEVGRRLAELGPGSSAIVGCDWTDGGGHWFNAVNDGGTVLAVDGQRNRVEPWPPSYRGVRFDESQMKSSDAIFFDPDGKAVQR
ncbi:MAG TPA: toxin glutamine deamidase domain-containing protein [Trebonia sp.]|jgi:hypothetical protein|nr:toxin glutamine deamidase domain-containing protein [Trebonia sp.]